MREFMKLHQKHDISKSVSPYTRLGTLLSAACLAASANSQLPPSFDDTDRTAPPAPLAGTPDFYSLPFPRLNRTEGTAPEIETASKYNTVSYSGSEIHQAADLKAK